MVLVRVWRRQLYGGMGAALLVPGMVLASFAVLALAGGFAGLTVLGQAFSGPAAPASALATDHAARARPLSPAIVAALSAPSARGGAASLAPPSAAGGGTGTAPRTATSTGPRASRHTVTSGGGRPAARGIPAPAPRPAPKPQPQPTLIDGIVSAGTSVSAKAPAPLGPAATNALQSAGATLDAIAPIKAP